MKKTIGVVVFIVWVLIVSAFLTHLWLVRPDMFPQLPASFAETLVHLYGAENAEQVSDLETLLGFAISIPLVMLVTCVAIYLLRKFRTN